MFCGILWVDSSNNLFSLHISTTNKANTIPQFQFFVVVLHRDHLKAHQMTEVANLADLTNVEDYQPQLSILTVYQHETLRAHSLFQII